MTLNIDNLPRKFYPHLLGREESGTDEKRIEQVINEKFTQPLNNFKKEYIFDGGSYIFKKSRADGLITTPDTHLYRVRKAHKIQKFIEKNEYEDSIHVPKKYLYWNKNEKSFYVVSEKVDLSNEVAHVAYPEFKKTTREQANQLGGQYKALIIDQKHEKQLTPKQAKALAELSFLGYTDQSYNNVFFTKDGKVAIIDTEPVKRALKKNCRSSVIFKVLGSMSSLKTQQSLTGTAKLKLYCNPLARKEVELVEIKHVLWSIGKLITEIALVAITASVAIYLLPHLPLFALGISLLKWCILGLVSMKVLSLSINILSINLIWQLSHQRGEGLSKIIQIEKAGYI